MKSKFEDMGMSSDNTLNNAIYKMDAVLASIKAISDIERQAEERERKELEREKKREEREKKAEERARTAAEREAKREQRFQEQKQMWASMNSDIKALYDAIGELNELIKQSQGLYSSGSSNTFSQASALFNPAQSGGSGIGIKE